ncbi:hypothetical protein [Archangium lipolyticum]|uniref:hypothetical protein n=1 Tax=Archangium lipolyticum TaxID=2970465 RepID=UPI00214A394C|nr:hypothetical protein [Archangium lipolyticum]
MNSQDLKNALQSVDGKVVASAGTLTSNIDNLLIDYYGNQPLVITGAQPAPESGSNQVRVSGRSSFMEMPDLPVDATFSSLANGNVGAALWYQLIGATPGTDRWKFSRSLPGLPRVLNYETPIPSPYDGNSPTPVDRLAGQIPYLDSLNLSDAYLVVASEPRDVEQTGRRLERGINFLGKLRPDGLLGILLNTFGGDVPLTLGGTLRIPKETDVTLPLNPREWPWQRQDVPGVLLDASLGKGGSLGKVRFENPKLRIYSPHDEKWMREHPSFQPVVAYTGTLAVPSAGIGIDVTATSRWGVDELTLFGEVQGVTLAKLADLADLAGGDDLMKYLPDELQKVGQALGKLALTYVSLSLGVGTNGLYVSSVNFTIGMPDCRWKVWDDHLAVRDLSCQFSISDPFGQRQVSLDVGGILDIEGVPFMVRASNANGFAVYARMLGGRSLPLGQLLESYVPDLPPPADLTIDSMNVTVAPGSFYSFSASLAGRPNEWVLDVGHKKLKMQDVALSLSCAKGGKVTGSFEGNIAFGKSRISARYNHPGEFAIRGSFPEIHVGELIDSLCDQKAPLPAGFDLTLKNSSVLIRKQGSGYVFQLATALDGVGLFAFEASKTGTQWGFAAGMDLGSVRLSSIPGLSDLKLIEDVVRLQKLLLVISSQDNANLQFPDLAQFNAPQLGTQKLALPAQAGGVTKGLMAFAEWQLDPNDRQHDLVMKLLGLGGTQRVTVAISQNPAAGSKLFFGQRTKIQGMPFDYQLGVMLTNGKPSFFLTGTLAAKIQGQPQTFDATTVFVPGGAFMSATMKGATAINCGPFKLSNLALQMGVNWGGIPSLGIAATIDVKNFESSLAVFFDSTDPSRSLVAGSISSLTAKDVVDVLVGGNPKTPFDEVLSGLAIKGTHQFTLPASLASELDGLAFDKVSAAFAAAKVSIPSASQQLSLVVNKKGAAWHLTDLSTMRHYELELKGGAIQARISPQFYFAPQPTFIGTIKYPQGYYLNAAISFLGFDAAATIDISQNKGFSVDAQMDKIVLVDERFFSISAAQGGGGPKLSISTFFQPEQPVEEFRPPHFYINGGLTMFGVKRSLFASVTSKGIEFELKGQLVPGAKFDVDVRFGKSGLDASGSVKVGIGTIDLGPLGKAKINTDIEASIDIDIDGKNIDMVLESSFEFAGQGFKIAKFKLDATPDAFTKLPEVMAKKVEAALRDAFSDATRWTNAVGKGVMEGVNDTEKVFRDVYKKTDKEAKELAKGVNTATKAVENTTKSVTKSVSKGFKKAFKF